MIIFVFISTPPNHQNPQCYNDGDSFFFDPATGGTYTTELSAPTHNPLWLKNSLLNPI